MIDRVIGPIVVVALFIAAMVGVSYGFDTLFDRMSGDFALGFVTAGVLGCAGYYVIRWLEPPSGSGGSRSATDHQRPRDPFQ